MLESHQDLGQFNDSTVFFKPQFSNPRSVPALNRHIANQLNSLGIYQPHKLSSLIESKQGQLVEFISYAQHSHNTFVTSEAMDFMDRYSTDEICFVVVVGEQKAGKSFLCDKILNLAEIRGNHFCRKSNKGINMWSTPFDKDGLKIFLLEINNCPMESYEFKLLATYMLMIGSAFVVVDSLAQNDRSSIQKLDEIINEITSSIGSNIEKEEREGDGIYQNIMPKLFYNLYRPSTKKATSSLKAIDYPAFELLPDALVKTYKGSSKDLTQLPLLDTKCISQEYVVRASHIFKDIYSKLSQKRYKELVLNGNIVAKVIKYIEMYSNNKSQLNIQTLYLQVVEGLYQSAYKYCILHYQEEMQREFDDQAPKDFQYLLQVFQRISDDTFQRFEEFNLDQRLYEHYYSKLQKHINYLEQKIMDINANKSEQIMNQLYDEDQIGKQSHYREVIRKLEKECGHLTHGKDRFIGKLNSRFYSKTKGSNNVDYLIMKQIQNIKSNIARQTITLQVLASQNQKSSKSQQKYLSSQKKVEQRIDQINRELDKAMRMSIIDANTQKKQIAELEKKITQNDKTIEDLKQDKGKHKRVTQLEMQIEEMEKKVKMQQNLLQQLNQSKKTQPPKK